LEKKNKDKEDSNKDDYEEKDYNYVLILFIDYIEDKIVKNSNIRISFSNNED